jgi:hypothetical protein
MRISLGRQKITFRCVGIAIGRKDGARTTIGPPGTEYVDAQYDPGKHSAGLFRLSCRLLARRKPLALERV